MTKRELFFYCLGGKRGLAEHKLIRAKKYLQQSRRDLYVRVGIGLATENEKQQLAAVEEAATMLWKLSWAV